MGYMRHHGFLVTGGEWGKVPTSVAQAKAVELFGAGQVSALSGEATNSYRSFAVFPDGSKEGWGESNVGDKRRSAFRDWLESCRYEDNSSPFAWVEVQYGDDEHKTKVVNDSDAINRPPRRRP